MLTHLCSKRCPERRVEHLGTSTICASSTYAYSRILPPTPVPSFPKCCIPKWIFFSGGKDLCCPLSAIEITICQTIILKKKKSKAHFIVRKLSKWSYR